MPTIQEQTNKDKVNYDGLEYDIPLYVVVYPGIDTRIVSGQITAIEDVMVGHENIYDPLIYLEDGTITYGHKCWWAPDTKLQEFKERLTASGYEYAEYEYTEKLGVVKDKCWLAMKEAWDTLAEHCGDAEASIDMDGISITVPVGIMEMGTHRYMSINEHIKAIAQTTWCRETAMGICENVLGCTADESAECVDSVSIRISTRIVG